MAKYGGKIILYRCFKNVLERRREISIIIQKNVNRRLFIINI